ncbi:hypothetical protein TNCV_3185171 [Trichonephila clavipes]|nr:hypothetical protein TNCV_3185171 [Trichonephila clavipes]
MPDNTNTLLVHTEYVLITSVGLKSCGRSLQKPWVQCAGGYFLPCRIYRSRDVGDIVIYRVEVKTFPGSGNSLSFSSGKDTLSTTTYVLKYSGKIQTLKRGKKLEFLLT